MCLNVCLLYELCKAQLLIGQWLVLTMKQAGSDILILLLLSFYTTKVAKLKGVAFNQGYTTSKLNGDLLNML